MERRETCHYRLLIVEDDPLVAASQRRVFEDYEAIAIEVAVDAGEALEWIETWKPSIVLLDLMLPYGAALEKLDGASDRGAIDTGIRLLRFLRSGCDPESEGPRFLVTTARTAIAVEQGLATLLRPGDKVLYKPFDTFELEAWVVDALGLGTPRDPGHEVPHGGGES